MNQGKFINERQLRTPPFRIMYPSLFEARAMKGEPESKARYSVTMVFDKATTDFALFNQLLASKAADLNGRQPTRATFRDGSEKAEHGAPFTDAVVFASASTKIQPSVFTASLERATPDQVIQGSYACAVVHAYAYDQMGNRGIALGLNSIQLLGGGERIETTVDPAALFDASSMQPTIVPESLSVGAVGTVAATGLPVVPGVPSQW